MPSSGNDSTLTFERLRQRAEELVRQDRDKDPVAPADLFELIHELRVSYAELEIQNEELRRAQQERDQLLADYARLYEEAPCGYITLNAKGLITRANRAALDILGCDDRHVLRSDLSRFIAPGWKDHFWEALQESGTKAAKQSLELKLISALESPVWVRADVVADGNSSGAVEQWRVILIDITESKQKKESLHHYENVVSCTPDGIALLDRQYRYRLVNEAYERFSGVSREWFIGRTVAEYLGEEVFQQYIKPNLDRCLQGETVTYQEWFTYPSLGKRFAEITYSPYLDSAKRVAGVVANTRDITESKWSELIMEARARLLQYSMSQSLEELLAATLDEAEHLTDSQIGFYHFLEPDQQTLSLQAWSTRTVSEACQAQGKGLHYDVAEAGVWVDCIHQRQAVIHNDYEALPGKKGLPPGHAAVVRELVVPVFRNDSIVGILGVGNKASDYSSADIETVTLLADLAWDMVESKRAEEALEHSYSQLKLRHTIARMFLLSSNDELYADILQLLLNEFGCRYGYLGFIDEHGDLVCPSMTRTVWDECLVPEKNIVFPRASWGGLCGESLEQGASKLRNAGLNPPEGHVPLHNALVVPMLIGEDLVGQIALANKPSGFTAQDKERLESLAELMAPVLRIYLDKEQAAERLEVRARELEEKNTALNVLLDKRDEDRKKTADAILRNAERLVFPYIDKLKSCRSEAERQTLAEILERNIQESLSALEGSIPATYRVLSQKEVQVADLIRAGKTCKEIAAILNLSPRSVFYHRDNIREKLGIKHTKTNLQAYLASLK